MTQTDDDLPVRIDRREVNMAKRRERIVNAARELIVETGTDSFSMKVLADKSDVSLATIYNLIGQKHDVLVQVFRSDIHQFFEDLGHGPHEAPFEHVFETIGVAVRNLFRDHRYYRVLFSALFSTSGFDLVQLYQQPRAHFWVETINQAIAQGLLIEGIKPSEVSHVLDDIYRSALIRWLWGTLDEPRCRALVSHRFTVVLLGYATPKGAALLRPRLAEFARDMVPTAPTKGAAGRKKAGTAIEGDVAPAITPTLRGSSRRRSE